MSPATQSLHSCTELVNAAYFILNTDIALILSLLSRVFICLFIHSTFFRHSYHPALFLFIYPHIQPCLFTYQTRPLLTHEFIYLLTHTNIQHFHLHQTPKSVNLYKNLLCKLQPLT